MSRTVVPDEQLVEFQALMAKLDELSQKGGYGIVVITASMQNISWLQNVPTEFMVPLARRWLESLENPQMLQAPILMSKGGMS